jgi:DNA replication protein DnaC
MRRSRRDGLRKPERTCFIHILWRVSISLSCHNSAILTTLLSGEYPGQVPTSNLGNLHLQKDPRPESSPESPFVKDKKGVTIEKSNVLLVGPSGVGKTLMIKLVDQLLIS